ncbi:MAG: cell division protein FtsB [Gammaproteobacteria bacterium]
MRLTSIVLTVFLLILQYHLWVGDGSLAGVWRNQQAILVQRQENISLQERNLAEEGEVNDLKYGQEAISERARSELGMIKKDEIFYQIVNE